MKVQNRMSEESRIRLKNEIEMIDTIEIKHFYQVLPVEKFKEDWNYLSRKNFPTWALNNKGEKTLPNLTILQTPNGVYHLSAEVSLPKMLFGHNARLPNQAEVIKGLNMISEYTKLNSGLPFDTASATVSKIHYAFDVLLSQSEVLPTIKRLADKSLKRMNKLFFDDSTLYFQTEKKTQIIRFYSKLIEVLSKKDVSAEVIKLATGVLRIENCFLKPRIINSFVDRNSLADKTAISLLNENVSELAISQVFEDLNFFEMLSNGKSNLDVLLENYEPTKAWRLFGFLEMVRQHGENFYKNESLAISKGIYYANLRDCRKAKVWKL